MENIKQAVEGMGQEFSRKNECQSKGAREMAQQLRTRIVLAEDPGWATSSYMCSQSRLILFLGDPVLSSGLYEHQACTRHTYKHSGKVLLHIMQNKSGAREISWS